VHLQPAHATKSDRFAVLAEDDAAACGVVLDRTDQVRARLNPLPLRINVHNVVRGRSIELLAITAVLLRGPLILEDAHGTEALHAVAPAASHTVGHDVAGGVDRDALARVRELQARAAERLPLLRPGVVREVVDADDTSLVVGRLVDILVRQSQGDHAAVVVEGDGPAGFLVELVASQMMVRAHLHPHAGVLVVVEDADAACPQNPVEVTGRHSVGECFTITADRDSGVGEVAVVAGARNGLALLDPDLVCVVKLVCLEGTNLALLRVVPESLRAWRVDPARHPEDHLSPRVADRNGLARTVAILVTEQLVHAFPVSPGPFAQALFCISPIAYPGPLGAARYSCQRSVQLGLLRVFLRGERPAWSVRSRVAAP